MAKSVNELYELCDVLYDLRARAVIDKRVATRKKLKIRIIDGADDLLSLTSGLTLESPSGSSGQGVAERSAEWRKIRSKAAELREWALRNL